MRTKTVIRYYCEHCSKGMFKKPSMIRHEATCCRNPERFCGLCESKWDYASIIEKLKGHEVVHWKTTPDERGDDYVEIQKSAVDWILSQVDGCPTCALAVILQSRPETIPNSYAIFNYKEQLAIWNKEKTNEFQEMVCGYYNHNNTHEC